MTAINGDSRDQGNHVVGVGENDVVGDGENDVVGDGENDVVDETDNRGQETDGDFTFNPTMFSSRLSLSPGQVGGVENVKDNHTQVREKKKQRRVRKGKNIWTEHEKEHGDENGHMG